ncbi:hypothetical protein CAEBREN_23564 [Caenorhabditis brenneri]|uniref:RING-type domain-containing protein n=1 Tax=Caenorhabditis brenneri TaxID=135651 RepID=G0MAK2_CAEBE|nr:hypothetical protein CAEBREN_23564 [Caenorhabditis brenneri]
MSTTQREDRLRNLQLARIKSETEEIKKKSADADAEIEALEQEIKRLDEGIKNVESTSWQSRFKNNRRLNCRNCGLKCNTTSKKPVALKCRHTICLPCFWQNYVASRDTHLRLNPRPIRVPVIFPCCQQHTNMPYDLIQQNVPKSHTTLQILEICEAE